MGLLTFLKSVTGSGASAIESEKLRLKQLKKEREELKEELEIREETKREEQELEAERKRLKSLKYDKFVGWLK